MNLLVSYQTIQYTAHPRSQINAVSFDTSSCSWKLEFWSQIYRKAAGATARSSEQLYSQMIFPVFSKGAVFTFCNAAVCIAAPLLMWQGLRHILDKKNQNKARLSNFSVFTQEQNHFTAFQQYCLAAKRYIHQITSRALIAHHLLMFFNILDYYKCAKIYQHCCQLIRKKIFLAICSFHSLEFSRLYVTLRGRFDFQRAFAMCAFGWKRAVVSARRSIAVGQYCLTNTKGSD